MRAIFRDLYKSAFIIWDGFWIIWVAEILFVLGCLPVITAPAALAGLYFTMNELANGESTDWKTFFIGIKKYFWAGYRWFAFNLLIGGVLVLNIFFYLNASNGIDANWSQVISGVPLGLLILWALINFLTFPLMLVQNKPTYWQSVRNSLVFYARWPGLTLVLGLLSAAILGLSIWLIFPALILGASLPALLGCICIKLKTEIPENKEGSD